MLCRVPPAPDVRHGRHTSLQYPGTALQTIRSWSVTPCVWSQTLRWRSHTVAWAYGPVRSCRAVECMITFRGEPAVRSGGDSGPECWDDVMARDISEEFVSEPLMPAPGVGAVAAMASGQPGLPQRFTWRTQEYVVQRVLQQWKSSGPCRSGSGEMYLRRHWFRVLVSPYLVMTIYFERQANRPRQPKARWWVYSISRTAGSAADGLTPGTTAAVAPGKPLRISLDAEFQEQTRNN